MRANLPDALGRLRDNLRAVRLDLALPGAEEARRTRDDLVAQVDDGLDVKRRLCEAVASARRGGKRGR
jgi:hypothetical protein